MISFDMKWRENTEFIKKRTFPKFWMLRRIKALGGSIQDMLEVYLLQIRCLCEIACPAWNGALTKSDCKQIERIQKMALRIILGAEYDNYEAALERLDIETLEKRRKDICVKFAKSIEKSDKFSNWLQPTARATKTSVRYFIPHVRTKAYQTSPLIYLTELLNNTS